MKVIVIGAGTGGLCLAQGLKRSGIEVAVYERDRTRSDGLQGYRVGIDPDGSRALHACLPKELYDTFVATCARAPRYGNIYTERLKEVLSVDSGPVSADPVDSEKSVSRMTMRQVLLTGLEDEVRFGKVFARYSHGADGRVTAHFEDGTTDTADLLVAADGSNSRVRRQYLPHAGLEDSGLVGVTGKLPLTGETRTLLPPKAIEGVSMIFAPGGYSCILHVMEFKWDQRGELKNGIGGDDAELLAAWPGLTFDNTRDYIMWGFAGARRNLPSEVLSMSGPQLHRMVRELTGRWHPNLRELVAKTDPTTCFPLNIRTSVPIPQWDTTNVTLLGDAIHTMTPGRGVGANTALRDAAILRRELVAVRDGEKPLLAAVRAYETRMIDYGFDAVVKSRRQMSGDDPLHRPVIGRIMLAGMRTAMRAVNHLPPLKRRMAKAQASYRGAGRDDF
ncbi:FAD-dependent oxidoreductase [Sphaerisporangium fuscum]|uniref:FAD-dependent oxidoreductase n=1 Tax=Sphaerisporangium fuscum TaxID=2835868 RepID=UPI001BDD98BD|nr:NAD(P)/FAD-dependent oxidoreductase [Sphaerisporangium fuscum]